MHDFIEISHLTFSYPLRAAAEITAIKNVSLSIKKGEFVSIIGANGSGKSTLGKLINALLIPDSGGVVVCGMNTKDHHNHPRIRSMVGMVFQRPQDQIVATTVEEDTAFGPSNLGLAPAEIRRRVNEALKTAGLEEYNNRQSYMLSAGETQRLALAGVLAMQPKCVIFDETTSMLDPLGREMVMQQASELKQQGVTVIFITHMMEEAAQADRVLVLHGGELVMDGTPRSIFCREEELRAYGLDLPEVTQLANALNGLFPEIARGELSESGLIEAIPVFTNNVINKQEKVKVPTNPDAVIQVDELSHTYMRGTVLAHQSLNEVTLKVCRGSAHGLMGSTGSGKSTLLQHLNALIRPQSGVVNVLGEDLTNEEVDTKKLRSQVGLVFQLPENQIFEQYVGDEVAFAARNFEIEGKISDIVRKAMNSVGLDFEVFKDRFTSTLSGGEQRKVALASVLAGQPEVLLLDEPLAGLDPRSRREISAHLRSLKTHGMTMVISTHQFEDVMGMLDRISALAHGTDVMSGGPGSVFSQIGRLEDIGIKPPLTFRTAEAFRRKGWPIPEDVVSSNHLINLVKNAVMETG